MDQDRQLIESDMDYIMERIMTTEEAAEAWGLSPVRIKHLCSNEKVVARKRGKTWLVYKNQPNPKQKESD
ncbi:helix-turn-helix domain-containing protein [Paenibacillus sp. FSL H8-0104]|uniref:helix-turn-helix domain-containing protein n=1 Tax=Paenibacillus sp. FSL H8-0104 TaxID=2954509 RepID=UPI0030FD969B